MKPVVGSIAHRDLFCSTFQASHRAFEPEQLSWPVLEQKHLDLLRTFPFWSFARSMEQEADRMIATFAKTLDDPTIRSAVELQGYEEGRHGRLLNYMLDHYKVTAASVPLSNLPVTREDFVTFGFSECTDSFVGFGGFALARMKQLFPSGLLEIFEQILFEEARHIVFFINWWRYEEARSGTGNAFTRTIDAIKYSIRATMHTAQGAQGSAVSTTPMDLTSGGTQAILDGVTPKMFLEMALAEERKMMSRIDRNLLRPRMIPMLATAALLGLRMLPPRIETIEAKRPLAVAS